MNTNSNTFQGAFSFTGRTLLASIFLISGLSKIADPTSTIGYISSVSIPFPEVAYVIATALEIIGGIFLILGYRVQPIAIALAVFSVLAGILFHGHITDQNQFAHLLKNISIAGGLLHIAAFGPGSFSLDQKRIALRLG